MTRYGHTVANTMAQDKSRRSHEEKRELVQDSHHHGLPAVVPSTPACPLPLRRFNSSRFVRFNFVVLRFKGLFFSHGGDPFPIINHYHLLDLILVLDQIREREREAKIARIPCQVCYQKTQVQFWLSISFPSLLFSHFNSCLVILI